MKNNKLNHLLHSINYFLDKSHYFFEEENERIRKINNNISFSREVIKSLDKAAKIIQEHPNLYSEFSREVTNWYNLIGTLIYKKECGVDYNLNINENNKKYFCVKNNLIDLSELGYEIHNPINDFICFLPSTFFYTFKNEKNKIIKLKMPHADLLEGFEEAVEKKLESYLSNKRRALKMHLKNNQGLIDGNNARFFPIKISKNSWKNKKISQLISDYNEHISAVHRLNSFI